MAERQFAITDCGTFVPGMFVNVMYEPPVDGSRLEVNLLSGEDSLLQVKTCCDNTKCSLGLNSKLGGGWNEPKDFLLDKNDTQLTISAETDSFDIYANKKKSYSYQYQDSVRRVKRIKYEGTTRPAMSVGMSLPVFVVGKVVYIQARAPDEGTFAIDFVSSSPTNYNLDNIPFHMSVQFGNNEVVRNTKTNGEWGEEEKNGRMPFTPGDLFKMTVFAQKEGFEVGVDGKHFTHYKYRTGFETEMSVQLENVSFIQKIEHF